MSSVMRWRSGVMESSFAKWYVLQAATPCFRTGARDAKARSAVERTARIYRFGGRQIPRSGLVQYRLSSDDEYPVTHGHSQHGLVVRIADADGKAAAGKL